MKSVFKRKVLKNGMTVLFEKRDLPIVSVAYAVRYGGVNEIEKEKGIAHFIEHMLYKGTAKRNSEKIAEEIEKKGGVMNGFTDEEVTAYWVKAPSKHFFPILDVLTDMVKNPLFDEKELEKERSVIFEEIKMRRDNPQLFVLDEIKSCLYEKPFGPSLIGTTETLSSLKRKDLTSKFGSVYAPENMIFVVVGDANFNQVCKYLEKNFPKRKANLSLPKISITNEEKMVRRKGIDQANLVFAFHAPKSKDRLFYATNVLLTLMGDGMSSRLFKEIREKRNLAYSIRGGLSSEKDFGYGFVYVGTTPQNVEKVKELILEEFEKVSKGLDEKELKAVKEQIIGNHLIEREDSQHELMFLLAAEIAGNAKNALEYEKNISKVKLKDVKNLAKINSYSFLALLPE